MKKLNVLFATLAILSVGACHKTPNKELIVGSWEITSVEFLDASKADEGMKNKIRNYNIDKRYEDFNKICFGPDKRFKRYKGDSERESNDFSEYRIINEKDFVDYPNFKNENENGNLIAFILIERDGSLYNGTNMFGPFEIVSLSKDELCLKDVHNKFFHKVIESRENQYLIKFKRI
jgi:hypothetical protein